MMRNIPGLEAADLSPYYTSTDDGKTWSGIELIARPGEEVMFVITPRASIYE